MYIERTGRGAGAPGRRGLYKRHGLYGATARTTSYATTEKQALGHRKYWKGIGERAEK